MTLTTLLFKKDIFGVLQLVYEGSKVEDACKELDICLASYHYCKQQLIAYYNARSMYELFHKLIMDGFIKNE